MYVVTIEDGKKRKTVRVEFTFPRDRFLLMTTLGMIEDRYRQVTEGRPVVMVGKKDISPWKLLEECKERLSYGYIKWKPVNIILDLKNEHHRQILELTEAEDTVRKMRKNK